ncbi:MAG: hypothetical protein V5A88_06910, partial [Candidatus Thermoplasmatota archaeon]
MFKGNKCRGRKLYSNLSTLVILSIGFCFTVGILLFVHGIFLLITLGPFPSLVTISISSLAFFAGIVRFFSVFEIYENGIQFPTRVWRKYYDFDEIRFVEIEKDKIIVELKGKGVQVFPKRKIKYFDDFKSVIDEKISNKLDIKNLEKTEKKYWAVLATLIMVGITLI